MRTFFAPAERADRTSLQAEIDVVDHSLVLVALLETINGLIAIVNELRQVVDINTTFLRFLGIQNPEEVLGLRPGEVVNCIHAGCEPGGCGTSRYCGTCGAAVAMMTSLTTNKPDERICSMSVTQNKRSEDMVFKVKAQPVTLERRRFLLLFLQDITLQEQRAALERTFYHDVNSTVNKLIRASELLVEESPGRLATTISRISMRLVNETMLQRCLLNDHFAEYQPVLETYTVREVNSDLQAMLTGHAAMQSKIVQVDCAHEARTLTTDHALLLRILSNMVVNALEASKENDTVRVWVTTSEAAVTWHVWNRACIPPEITLRVFQRYFSTKAASGRGTGTYSIKLFGEKYLGGVVDFSSTSEGGTEFRIALPVTVDDESNLS